MHGQPHIGFTCLVNWLVSSCHFLQLAVPVPVSGAAASRLPYKPSRPFVILFIHKADPAYLSLHTLGYLSGYLDGGSYRAETQRSFRGHSTPAADRLPRAAGQTGSRGQQD